MSVIPAELLLLLLEEEEGTLRGGDLYLRYPKLNARA